MTTARWFTTAAYGAIGVGVLVPFAVSDWRGMGMAEHPWTVPVTAAAFALAVLLEYRADRARGAESAEPRWRRWSAFVGRTSAVWLLIGMAVGFVYHPTISQTFFGTHFTTVLAVTLAVMGVQISWEAWRRLASDVRPVLVLVVLRWVLMPLIGYCIAFVAFHPFLPEETAQQLAIGMILLCTSPTGAASNSLTLISKGDLALSVSATTVNVLVAPFLQPLLVRLMAGRATTVDTSGIFGDLALYVLAPVLLASLVGILVPRLVERVKPALPAVAVLSLACVLMGTLSNGTETILGNLGVIGFVVAACVVHGWLGMTAGYVLPTYLGLDRRQRVAASYEVGIENAAIAPALAITYFGPLALLPAVVYGKTQNLLAATVFVPFYRRRIDEDVAREGEGPAGTPDERVSGDAGRR